jgi:RHS repeat-associated protein
VVNDNEHGMNSYQGTTYGYVNDERLSSVSSVNNNYQLAYDALGRCVKRTLNNVATYYVYDGEKPILEYNAANTVVGRNLYGKGIDEILMRTDATLGTYYYQDDHEGSVTQLTSAAGAILERYRYDVFGAPSISDANGNPLNPPNASAYNSRFMFTGREYTSTFSIYEYRARAYHPGLGRFTGEDPKGFDAGDYNLFRYCHNDPEDLVDPMGLEIIVRGDVEAWKEARAYLERSATARQLISRADGKDVGKIYIKTNNSDRDMQQINRNGMNAIQWDPHSGTLTTEGGRQSPALALIGEIDHAARAATDLPGQMQDNLRNPRNPYGTPEEERVHGDGGSEARTAAELSALGFPEDRRHDHKGTPFRTGSPTSRTLINRSPLGMKTSDFNTFGRIENGGASGGGTAWGAQANGSFVDSEGSNVTLAGDIMGAQGGALHPVPRWLY